MAGCRPISCSLWPGLVELTPLPCLSQGQDPLGNALPVWSPALGSWATTGSPGALGDFLLGCRASFLPPEGTGLSSRGWDGDLAPMPVHSRVTGCPRQASLLPVPVSLLHSTSECLWNSPGPSCSRGSFVPAEGELWGTDLVGPASLQTGPALGRQFLLVPGPSVLTVPLSQTLGARGLM